MGEMNLKKTAAKLSMLAGKSVFDSKDLALLREIRDALSLSLSALKECDCCGAAVSEVAKLEMDGIKAVVCSACGIKAFKNRELIIKNVKRRESAKTLPKPIIRSKPFKTETKANENQPTLFGESIKQSDKNKGGGDLEAIALAAGSKTITVKKILSIASGVAFPMNIERTISFVKIEAQSQQINFKEDEIRRVVSALKDNGLLRVKDS